LAGFPDRQLAAIRTEAENAMRTRLGDFIVANREPILLEWEAFARTCAPASAAMDLTALRDHANEMLTVIAKDLENPQTVQEGTEKSKGELPPEPEVTTAAEQHGAGRAESGFTVEQMVAEFRALRASVIRLWVKSTGTLQAGDLDDLTRFNEAIDQSLSESVSRYTQDLDHSKDMFLAILGHDLRTPLGAIIMSSEFMLETKELGEPHLTLTSRIKSSSRRMEHLIGDLLDFTRSRLGGGIPIERAPMSMDKAVHDVIDEIAAAHPNRVFHIEARTGVRGNWDCQRVSQALTNIVVNALDHGAEGTVVTATVESTDTEVSVAVHNRGAPITAAKLNGIFNPMKNGKNGAASNGAQANLGLGLYIAERIVNAHQGRLDVQSSEAAGTTFTMRLPRSV
jgi:signal transduction histidine kinase